MHKDTGTKIHFCLLLTLLFLTACPPERDYLYETKEPIMMAFTHQVNFDSLKNEIAKDTFLDLPWVDDGLQLLGESGLGLAYDLWLNDSLLIVKIKGFYVGRRQGINSKSGRILFDTKQRKRRVQLFEDISKMLDGSSFENKNFHPRYRRTGERSTTAFSIKFKKIIPADALNWNGSVLGVEGNNVAGQFYFEKGILQDTFTMRDTIRSLFIKGVFEKGVAIGDWAYFDLSGNLQWTESFRKGELINVDYAKGASMKRPARLMTLGELSIFHWFFLFVFLISFGTIFWFYIKSYKGYSFPHRKKNVWSVIGLVFASPIISITISVIFVIVMFLMMTILTGIGWDLPFDFISVLFLWSTFYFPFGVINFIITLRVEDIFWHVGLMCFGFLSVNTFWFLIKLGAYMA